MSTRCASRGYATRLPEGTAPHHRHSERRGAERSIAPRSRGISSSASRSDTADAVAVRRGALGREINVHPPLESMLRPCARCLVEALFERIPPLRAFGPPVGMTMVGVYKLLGGMATQSVAMGRRTDPLIFRPCPRERGHATRLPEGVAPSSSFRAKRRAAEESVLPRRAATPLILLWHGAERLAADQRSPPP